MVICLHLKACLIKVLTFIIKISTFYNGLKHPRITKTISILKTTLFKVVMKCKFVVLFNFWGFFSQNVCFWGCKVLSHQVSSIQSTQFFQWYFASVRFMFLMKHFSTWSIFHWLLKKCLSPISIAIVVMETTSFIRIMQSKLSLRRWSQTDKESWTKIVTKLYLLINY